MHTGQQRNNFHTLAARRTLVANLMLETETVELRVTAPSVTYDVSKRRPVSRERTFGVPVLADHNSRNLLATGPPIQRRVHRLDSP